MRADSWAPQNDAMLEAMARQHVAIGYGADGTPFTGEIIATGPQSVSDAIWIRFGVDVLGLERTAASLEEVAESLARMSRIPDYFAGEIITWPFPIFVPLARPFDQEFDLR